MVLSEIASSQTRYVTLSVSKEQRKFELIVAKIRARSNGCLVFTPYLQQMQAPNDRVHVNNARQHTAAMMTVISYACDSPLPPLWLRADIADAAHSLTLKQHIPTLLCVPFLLVVVLAGNISMYLCTCSNQAHHRHASSRLSSSTALQQRVHPAALNAPQKQQRHSLHNATAGTYIVSETLQHNNAPVVLAHVHKLPGIACTCCCCADHTPQLAHNSVLEL